MAQVTVRINDYAYTVGCEEGQEAHLDNMAAEIGQRIKSIKAIGGQSGEARLLMLAGLLLADEAHDLNNKLKILRDQIRDNAEAAAKCLPELEDIIRQQIPASDRSVTKSDNSPEFAKAIEKLDEISERIRTSNDLMVDAEQRLVLSRQVNALREALTQPLIRLGAVWNATTGTGVLTWLTTHGSDAILNALAVETIEHLFKACGLN